MVNSDKVMQSGSVTAVRGSVVEIAFANGLPAINEALRLEAAGRTITLEVAHHLDPHTVRAIAMAPDRGPGRGMPVERTGQPITVPVGPADARAAVQRLGEPLDGGEPPDRQPTLADPSSSPVAGPASGAASSSWRPESRSSTFWRPWPAAARRG